MKYKPYPKYKDSGVEWLGEIPEGWKVLDLKFGTQIELSNIDKHSSESEQPVKLCNYVDVYRNERITSSLAFMQATASHDQIERLTIQNGDVIITKDSETPEDIGISAFVEETAENLVCGYHLCLIRPNVYQFSGRLLHWFFSSHSAKAYFYTEAVGMTRFALSKYSIANTSVPVPPLPTQRAIATFLDTETARIDDLIKDYEELIELLKEKRQALISHAVTRGLSELVGPDDPEFGEWAKPVKFKDSGVEWIGEIPEGWDTKRVKHIKSTEPFSFVDGPFGSNLKSEHFVDNGDVYVIESNFATQGKLTPSELKTITSEHFASIKRSEVRAGDIVIAKIGALFGRATILPAMDKKAVVSGNSLKLTVNRAKCSNRWAELFFKHLKTSGQIDLTVNGSAQPALSLGDMNNLNFLLPSISEQKAITSYLDRETSKLETLVSESESAIELLKEHRSALITNAVTGKINVEASA